ncbi:MAG: serine protease [Clostridia bacterium]|nr:serine protease [Clostridia bacterium]
MKKILVLMLALFVACATGTNTTQTKSLSKELKSLVNESCFEVVVNKPVKDTLTYEKELPWHLIPYNIRVDKYFSIGTAFAISPTELLTAFHVLDLKTDSLIYKDFYIRDAQGNVYEIDKILAFDSHRDFIRFTVKNKTFSRYLKLKETFTIGDNVFAVGNAYGEGIVIRQGELIGTYPEPEDGRFNLLKSSSDVNFGNSGGPLIDEQANVIGVVIQRKDNIAYSLPVSEVNKTGNRGVFHVRMNFGFTLLPEKTIVKDFDDELSLPKGYKEIKKTFNERFKKFYIATMDELLKGQGKGMFPEGEESLIPLFDFTDSYFLQVNYLSKDNNRWTISNVEYKETKIHGNGVIRMANPDKRLLFIDISRPDDVSLQDMLNDPKVGMRLVLEGQSITRDFGDVKTRILSLGDPIAVEYHTDKYGRKWRLCTWVMEYSDEAIISCATPTPEGMSAVVFVCETSEIEFWKYDALKLLDYIQLSYYGRLKDWKAFLTGNKLLPKALHGVKFDYAAQKGLQFGTGAFSINTGNDIIAISDDVRMGINFGYIKQASGIEWAIRRVMLTEYQKDNYFVLVNWVAPDTRLPKDYLNYWDSIVNAEHPYTMKPFTSDNTTKIAAVVKKIQEKPEKVRKLYTLFLGKAGKVEDDRMIQDFKKLLNGIIINE